MTRRSLLAGASVIFDRSLLNAQDFQLAPRSGSSVSLEVRKTGLMAGKKHTLVFTQYHGSVVQQPAPKVVFTVQTRSLECQDDWLKARDRQKVARYAIDELLDAARYPVLRFESSGVVATGESFRITGDLTIRDNTRPVVVTAVRRVNGNQTFLTGGATIQLTDFKLKPPTAALGTVGTEDAMQLAFHLLADSA